MPEHIDIASLRERIESGRLFDTCQLEDRNVLEALVNAVEEARSVLEIAQWVGECAEHPDHLMEVEQKARRALEGPFDLFTYGEGS